MNSSRLIRPLTAVMAAPLTAAWRPGASDGAMAVDCQPASHGERR